LVGKNSRGKIFLAIWLYTLVGETTV